MADQQQRQTTEVLYDEGATPLFLAIEDTEWRDALDIAQANSEQVSTWVRSRGTENTTFQWSMWRRLPIHEACRRAAPAWFIATLLSTFPESAYMTTQLGELPLHLAVDSGAAPETVNLIIVANWSAIITPDQSGRIPPDILDRNELLALDDHRIVHESLLRCHKAYTDFQNEAQMEQNILKSKHKATVQQLTMRFEQELHKEAEKQNLLKDEVRMLESHIEDMREVDSAKEHKIKKFHEEKNLWIEQMESLEATVLHLKGALEDEKRTVNDLIETIREKDLEIEKRDDRISLLSNDLRDVASMQEGAVMERVLAAESTMRAMVSSQIMLQKELAGQANSLKTLLKDRGIYVADKSLRADSDEKKEPHAERGIDENEAANALAAAAVAALTNSN